MRRSSFLLSLLFIPLFSHADIRAINYSDPGDRSDVEYLAIGPKPEKGGEFSRLKDTDTIGIVARVKGTFFTPVAEADLTISVNGYYLDRAVAADLPTKAFMSIFWEKGWSSSEKIELLLVHAQNVQLIPEKQDPVYVSRAEFTAKVSASVLNRAISELEQRHAAEFKLRRYELMVRVETPSVREHSLAGHGHVITGTWENPETPGAGRCLSSEGGAGEAGLKRSDFAKSSEVYHHAYQQRVVVNPGRLDFVPCGADFNVW